MSPLWVRSNRYEPSRKAPRAILDHGMYRKCGPTQVYATRRIALISTFQRPSNPAGDTRPAFCNSLLRSGNL